MADSVMMTSFSEDQETGQVEIHFTWRGESYEIRFENKARMIEVASEPIQSPTEAARVLLSFWLAKDPTAITPPVASLNKLTIDYAAPTDHMVRATADQITGDLIP